MGKGNFGCGRGVYHCNQLGLFLHSCVKVHEAIELPFGVVSGVAPVIGVLDGVHIPKEKGVWTASRPLV